MGGSERLSDLPKVLQLVADQELKKNESVSWSMLILLEVVWASPGANVFSSPVEAASLIASFK